MKKSVIILIFLIYVASITVVGFLGLKASTYNEVIYVESLEILSDYSVDRDTGNKYIIFRANGTAKSFQFECKITPDNASDKNIIYALDNNTKVASIDENGLLTFNVNGSNPVSVKVYIYSHQNPTISDEIVVYYIP